MWKAAGLIVLFICVQLAVTNGQQQQQSSSRLFNAQNANNNDASSNTNDEGRRIDACKTKSGLAPHAEYCDEFYECIGGQEVLRECPNGLVFVGQGHGLVANCHYPFIGDCEGRPKRLAGQQRGGFEDDPCKKRIRLSFDRDHCDRYWECIDDQAVQLDCPNGLVFSGRRRGGVVGGCDYEWRAASCEDGGRTRANPPIQAEHCDWLYGIFGHETSCTRYWTCWNGTATEQFCIGGLLYNEKTRACDWPENVEGCQKHPLCKDFPNGNVALGKSCNRYWHCQGGYPRLQRCPAMLVFDKNSLRCVVPPTEDCEVPSTTTEAAQNAEDFEEGDGEGNNNGVQQQKPQQQQNNNRGNSRPQQSQGGGRPISIGAPIPVGAQRFNNQQQQQAQPLPQFSNLPQLPGGAIPLGNIQQQQPQQRNRFQQ